VSGQAAGLARIPDTYGEDLQAWSQASENRRAKPGSGDTHPMIPKEYVIDAVDIVYAPVTQRNKCVYPSEDIGMVWVDGSDNGSLADAAFSFKSLRRKVVSFTPGGQPVYKDTNNSSEDFVTGGTRPPTPFVHPSTVD
jgi:hypothetical protein